MKTEAVIYSGILIIWFGWLQLCLEWKEDGSFQNLLCPGTILFKIPTDSLGRCLISCDRIDECSSVLFISGPVLFCYFVQATLLPTSGCIPVSNGTLYRPSNGEITVSVCHPDDGLYRTVQLADGPLTYMIKHANVNQETAQQQCKTSGGFLAKLSTAPRNELAYKLMTTCEEFGGPGRYYIDGSNENATDYWKNDEWKWHDGEVINATLWGKGKPNTPNISHCVAIEDIYDWKLNDEKCKYELSFICEKK